MRTTLDLDDDLLARAKKTAAEAGRILTSLVEEALRTRLLKPPVGETPFCLELPTERGEAPPAVDIADRAELYDRLDGRT